MTDPKPITDLIREGRELMEKADISATDLSNFTVYARNAFPRLADEVGRLIARCEPVELASTTNLRASQDEIIERCAKAVEDWPDAAKRLRTHCGLPDAENHAVSGEDFGEMRRALVAAEQRIRVLTEVLESAPKPTMAWHHLATTEACHQYELWYTAKLVPALDSGAAPVNPHLILSTSGATTETSR